DSECSLTVEIHQTKIDGESNVRELCASEIGNTVLIKTTTYCCDTPPCSSDHPNGIFFSLPTPKEAAYFVDKGKSPEGLYKQGLIKYSTGNEEEAIALWREVLELDPNFQKARSALKKA